jgi:hypothetical protein
MKTPLKTANRRLHPHSILTYCVQAGHLVKTASMFLSSLFCGSSDPKRWNRTFLGSRGQGLNAPGLGGSMWGPQTGFDCLGVTSYEGAIVCDPPWGDSNVAETWDRTFSRSHFGDTVPSRHPRAQVFRNRAQPVCFHCWTKPLMNK